MPSFTGPSSELLQRFHQNTNPQFVVALLAFFPCLSSAVVLLGGGLFFHDFVFYRIICMSMYPPLSRTRTRPNRLVSAQCAHSNKNFDHTHQSLSTAVHTFLGVRLLRRFSLPRCPCRRDGRPGDPGLRFSRRMFSVRFRRCSLLLCTSVWCSSFYRKCLAVRS